MVLRYLGFHTHSRKLMGTLCAHTGGIGCIGLLTLRCAVRQPLYMEDILGTVHAFCFFKLFVLVGEELLCMQIQQYVERAETLKEVLRKKKPSQRVDQPPTRLLGKHTVWCMHVVRV